MAPSRAELTRRTDASPDNIAKSDTGEFQPVVYALEQNSYSGCMQFSTGGRNEQRNRVLKHLKKPHIDNGETDATELKRFVWQEINTIVK